MTEHRVFVYGTLKRGERNHAYLQDSAFAGEAVTADPHYVMVAFNSRTTPGSASPGVLHAEGAQEAGFIAGEVFVVDDHTLDLLDRLENVGVSYDRKSITLGGGQMAVAYIRCAGTGSLAAECKSIHLDTGRIYRWCERAMLPNQ